jgi:DnaJ-class molecular chaperone
MPNIRIRVEEECTACRGSGQMPARTPVVGSVAVPQALGGAPPIACAPCNGEGWVEKPLTLAELKAELARI